jgi:hypothetical protein
VHEDLICRTSTLFKSKLQKNRKLIHPGTEAEECCVCQEDLDPTIADIAYCVTCGQNIHNSCIDQWKRTSNNQASERRPTTTCPMCRATWKNEAQFNSLTLDSTLDAEAVQIYLDWLYTSSVRTPSTLSPSSDGFNLLLLKCWAVANVVEDITFRNDVVTTFFTKAVTQPWKQSVKWAFTEGYATDEIKDFVVDVFIAHMEPGWFREESASWPDVFVREVAERVFEGMGSKREYDDIKRDWMEELEGKEVVVYEAEKAVAKRSLEVEESSDRGGEAFSWLDMPRVKSKRRTVVEVPRVHVVERRPERAKDGARGNVPALTAHAVRFLRSSR